jgi:hypothetical protein
LWGSNSTELRTIPKTTNSTTNHSRHGFSYIFDGSLQWRGLPIEALTRLWLALCHLDVLAEVGAPNAPQNKAQQHCKADGSIAQYVDFLLHMASIGQSATLVKTVFPTIQGQGDLFARCYTCWDTSKRPAIPTFLASLIDLVQVFALIEYEDISVSIYSPYIANLGSVVVRIGKCSVIQSGRIASLVARAAVTGENMGHPDV